MVGDRTLPGGLDALDDAGSGEWDLVVDTWSWAPRAVTDAAAQLSGRAGRYAYVSSRSVYASAAAGDDETAQVVDASADDDVFGDYARAKAGGELGAVAAFGDRALLVRAGLILGPRENIGRLPWWLTRIARGGAVPAPAPADLGIQYVDARDLARFALTTAGTGVFNVVTPEGSATMGRLLEACRVSTGSLAELRWIEPARILEAGVSPWTDLPVWIPAGEDHDSMHRGDVSRALAAGLEFRTLEATVADTWAWLRSIGGVAPQRPDRPRVGLAPEAEALLLGG
jgi:nucleoside-diphosphate-sugar epimerase